MIEYGPAHGLQWTQSIIVLTSNAGASRAAQIANERAQVCRPPLATQPAHSAFSWSHYFIFPTNNVDYRAAAYTHSRVGSIWQVATHRTCYVHHVFTSSVVQPGTLSYKYSTFVRTTLDVRYYNPMTFRKPPAMCRTRMHGQSMTFSAWWRSTGATAAAMTKARSKAPWLA